jgi:uncharacterized integral membrane protein
MLRKIVTALILIPLVVVIVAFAVANRQAATVSFDPFSTAHPAYAVTLPLFAIVFVLLIIGVIVGGFAAWLRQSHWRRATRKLDAEVRALHDELDAMRRQFGGTEQPPQPESTPPLMLPPMLP